MRTVGGVVSFASSVFTTTRDMISEQGKHAKTRIIEHDFCFLCVAHGYINVFGGSSNGCGAFWGDFGVNINAVVDVSGELAPDIFT